MTAHPMPVPAHPQPTGGTVTPDPLDQPDEPTHSLVFPCRHLGITPEGAP